MDKELENLISIYLNSNGKDISIFEQSFLLRALDKRKLELGLKKSENYFKILMNDGSERQAFTESLIINYTEFFREPLTFTLLEKVLLPKILSSKRQGQEIRIWSAGCSFGQEPYSIAILLADLAESTNQEFKFRIFATDIFKKALDVGSEGTYHNDSIQNIKLKHLNKYFVRQGNSNTVSSKLKRHVNFSFYDLLDRTTSNPPESIYGDFDIIMCSNLFFYYNPECQKIIINKLISALLPSGFLITGETEKNIVENMTKLKAYNIGSPIFSKQKEKNSLNCIKEESI